MLGCETLQNQLCIATEFPWIWFSPETSEDPCPRSYPSCSYISHPQRVTPNFQVMKKNTWMDRLNPSHCWLGESLYLTLHGEMSWNVHVCWLKPSINPLFHDGYVAAVAHTLCGSRDVTLKCNSPVSAVLAVRQWVLHMEKIWKNGCWLLSSFWFSQLFVFFCFLVVFSFFSRFSYFWLHCCCFCCFCSCLDYYMCYCHMIIVSYVISSVLSCCMFLIYCFFKCFFSSSSSFAYEDCCCCCCRQCCCCFFLFFFLFFFFFFWFCLYFFLLVPLVFSVPWPVSVAKSQGQDQMARCDVDVSHAQLQACWKRWQTGQHWPENGDELGMVHWLCHIHKRSSWPLHSTIVAIVIKRTNLYEQVSKKALVQIGLTSAHSFTPKESK